MRQVYLICPVRGSTIQQRIDMDDYVIDLEKTGKYKVHFPPRDVNQSNDDGGVRICYEHVDAMAQCDEIHVWLDENQGMSVGSHFDLGMAFVFRVAGGRTSPLRFIIANPPLDKTVDKSFTNLLRSLVYETKQPS